MHRDWGTTTATGLGNGPNSGCHGNLRMWSMKKRRLRVTNIAWQHPSSRVKAIILSLLPASSCPSRSLTTSTIRGHPKKPSLLSLKVAAFGFGIIYCDVVPDIAVQLNNIDVFKCSLPVERLKRLAVQ